MFEDRNYGGTTATLCYASKTEASIFKLEDYGIESIGSYKAGSTTEFRFCHYISAGWGRCTASAGPFNDPRADVDSSKNIVELSYKNW